MFLTELRPMGATWAVPTARPQSTDTHANSHSARTHESQPTWQPRARYFETPTQFGLQFEIPGIDPATIELTLANGELTLKGTKPTFTVEGAHWHLDEIPTGTFERIFSFPTHVDTDTITAETRLGVLAVTVAKAPEAITRKIPITIAK